jgi:hypothetical protein
MFGPDRRRVRAHLPPTDARPRATHLAGPRGLFVPNQYAVSGRCVGRIVRLGGKRHLNISDVHPPRSQSEPRDERARNIHDRDRPLSAHRRESAYLASLDRCPKLWPVRICTRGTWSLWRSAATFSTSPTFTDRLVLLNRMCRLGAGQRSDFGHTPGADIERWNHPPEVGMTSGHRGAGLDRFSGSGGPSAGDAVKNPRICWAVWRRIGDLNPFQDSRKHWPVAVCPGFH